VKIFISYSRRDAGDFANQIQRHLSSFKFDVFTDVDSIRAGEVWSNTLEQNISNCDIFVVIITYGSLHSPHVEREVLQAQKENKTIIPCFHKTVIENNIKWGLDKIQGVEFDDKYELARNIQSKISRNKSRGRIFGTTSKTIEETKTHYAPTTTIKSDSSKQFQRINLKIIIIPIIAVAIIGLIVVVSYFDVAPPLDPDTVIPKDTRKTVTQTLSDDTTQSIMAIIENQMEKSDINSQNQTSYFSINTTEDSSSNSLINVNALDENQLIDAISLNISRVHNFEKNKITQALNDLTEATKANGGDVMINLRQIATIIIKDPSDPLSDKIIELAKTK